ncbi:hypothetical protein [Microbulbifer epialgicus]|uniref:Uncharacterized protein n=1 Tax=Microbulbifer epialgicus TaxID=393907 RepID=A0ABV4NUA5_9GAMM
MGRKKGAAYGENCVKAPEWLGLHSKDEQQVEFCAKLAFFGGTPKFERQSAAQYGHATRSRPQGK